MEHALYFFKTVFSKTLKSDVFISFCSWRLVENLYLWERLVNIVKELLSQTLSFNQRLIVRIVLRCCYLICKWCYKTFNDLYLPTDKFVGCFEAQPKYISKSGLFARRHGLMTVNWCATTCTLGWVYVA